MFSGLKNGNVEMKAIRPEMNRTASAYEVFVGIARICVAGVDRIDRNVRNNVKMLGRRIGPRNISSD